MRLVKTLSLVACSGWSAIAQAQASTLVSSQAAPAVLPEPNQPRTERTWLQYGAALSFEGRARAGNICPDDASVPCILGSGGGLTLRLGERSAHGTWFLGGAYEFTRHNASNLLKLPILQQARFEARYHFVPEQQFSPYLIGAAGFAVYGPQWGVSTYGPVASLGVGLEIESSRGVFFGLALAYRVMRLAAWKDRAGQEREAAFAHFIAFEVSVETRTPVARW